MDETEALRAEVAELRAEVERLKLAQASHYCAPNPVCQQWYPAAAAAGVPTTFTIPFSTAAAQPFPVYCDPARFTAGCAGGALPLQVFTGNVGG